MTLATLGRGKPLAAGLLLLVALVLPACRRAELVAAPPVAATRPVQEQVIRSALPRLAIQAFPSQPTTKWKIDSLSYSGRYAYVITTPSTAMGHDRVQWVLNISESDDPQIAGLYVGNDGETRWTLHVASPHDDGPWRLPNSP